jgi:diguanylate cyclase (GGDEF)-like protein
MREMPTDAQFDVRNAPLDAAQAAALRAEVERLRHENRALVTALAELALIAERDCLTELFNRRYLLAALERRIRAVSRGAARAALIYLDVDGLKGINDRHGHAAGDHVLSEIARRLRAAVCDGDVVARIGGDEFAVLLDNLGPAETKQRLDRLIASVKGTPCRFKDQEIAVSAAFGVGMIRPGDDAEDLLCRADARMYRDKRGG